MLRYHKIFEFVVCWVPGHQQKSQSNRLLGVLRGTRTWQFARSYLKNLCQVLADIKHADKCQLVISREELLQNNLTPTLLQQQSGERLEPPTRRCHIRIIPAELHTKAEIAAKRRRGITQQSIPSIPSTLCTSSRFHVSTNLLSKPGLLSDLSGSTRVIGGYVLSHISIIACDWTEPSFLKHGIVLWTQAF